MREFDDRVTIAQVPTGQPLDLFSAICTYFGAAIDGAVIVEGDGLGIAARLLAAEGASAPEVAAQLRTAADSATGRESVTQSVSEPDDGLIVGHVQDSDHGLTIGVGGSQLAEEWAAHLLGIFMPAFEELAVDNYLEYEGTDRISGQRLLLTVVKPGGKRPSELRAEAEAEAARLRALLEKNGIEVPA